MNINTLKRVTTGKSQPKTNNEMEELMGMGPASLLGMSTGKSDYKTFSSKFHTLFIEKDKLKAEKVKIQFDKLCTILEPDQKVHFEGIEDGSIELMAPELEFQRYTLHLGDFMHYEEDQVSVNGLIYEIDRANEEDTITLHISSHGGLLDEYLKFKNHILSSFPGKVTTICDPMGYSAGAMMFLIGDQRVVYEDCSMMFHTYSGGCYGKGAQMADHVSHSETRFNAIFERELVQKGYMTDEEFASFKYGKEFWLTFDKIIDRGIATHVYVDGCLLTVEEYAILGEVTEAEVIDTDTETAETVSVVETPVDKPDVTKSKTGK